MVYKRSYKQKRFGANPIKATGKVMNSKFESVRTVEETCYNGHAKYHVAVRETIRAIEELGVMEHEHMKEVMEGYETGYDWPKLMEEKKEEVKELLKFLEL